MPKTKTVPVEHIHAASKLLGLRAVMPQPRDGMHRKELSAREGLDLAEVKLADLERESVGTVLVNDSETPSS